MVAQKLIIGHMKTTVTQARTVVTKTGLSLPGTAILKAIFGARRSIKKNPMTKQMGNIKRISRRAEGKAL